MIRILVFSLYFIVTDIIAHEVPFGIHDNYENQLTPLFNTEYWKKKWNSVDPNLEKKIGEWVLARLGFSSTGNVYIAGSYRITHKSKFSNVNDRILHLVHKDLFGARLLWTCLINIDNKKYKILYQSGPNPDLDTIGYWEAP